MQYAYVVFTFETQIISFITDLPSIPTVENPSVPAGVVAPTGRGRIFDN
jgi:hypothetical protein